MKPLKSLALVASLVALSACSGGGLVSRNSLPDLPLLGAMQGEPVAPVPLNPSYRVTGVEVIVPAELSVSEENGIKPRADILWQEEAAGNRHAQVDALLTAALTDGVAGLNGSRPVKIEAVVTRFHALTKRTRYSYGGEHEVWMVLAVRDAATGALLEPARQIGFDLSVSAAEALANEARGIFQRDEITAEVKRMIGRELTRPRDFLQTAG